MRAVSPIVLLGSSKSDEAEAYRLVKADRICAYIKCISRQNPETQIHFAQKTIMDSIVSLNLREADYLWNGSYRRTV